VETSHCLAPARLRRPVDAPLGATSYGRLFPSIEPFSADEAFLFALGRAGGVCDCSDLTDDEASASTEAAGWPIFGQLIAHDMTADRSAPVMNADVGRLRNARTPQLDLESIYGDGPTGHPFLFQRNDPAKFLLGPDEGDMPRNAEGTALSADPRDDSHLLISQLHLAMLKVHNALVDRARDGGTPSADVFATAARETRWHYQWTVLHEFLPSLVGEALTRATVDSKTPLFRPDAQPFIPLEFADAAYRYGHCQIRHEYRLNERTGPMPLFPDLLGFRAVPPERRVDWSLFFDGGGDTGAEAHRPQRSKKMDGKLVRGLIQLPVAITGECEVEELQSLAVRDLTRGQGVQLPSGEALSRHLGIEPLTTEEVALTGTGWKGETPLWFYILRESDVRTGGHRLGPLGGIIVAETIVGLLRADSSSLLNAGEPWRPVHGNPGTGGLMQLLEWAGAAR
jgi:hypothetical protein